MAERIRTRLIGPPRLTGGPEQEIEQLLDWAARYHETLNPVLIQAFTQLAEAQDEIENLRQRLNAVADVGTLTQAISSPPTQQEVEAIQQAVNDIIKAAAK
jgi:HAMP domain-containing protein